MAVCKKRPESLDRVAIPFIYFERCFFGAAFFIVFCAASAAGSCRILRCSRYPFFVFVHPVSVLLLRYIRLFLWFDLLCYPIPIHSIQMLIAFVNTTFISPREMPEYYHGKSNRGETRADPPGICQVFHLFHPFSASSCAFTSSVHPSRSWLPSTASPRMFPFLSTKKLCGNALIPLR